MATVTKKFLNEVAYDENDLAAFLKAASTVDMVKLNYEDGNIVVGDGVVVMDGFVYQIDGYDFLAPGNIMQNDVELGAYFGYNEQTETHSWQLVEDMPTDPLGFTKYVKVLVYNTKFTNQVLTSESAKKEVITSTSPQGVIPYDIVHINSNQFWSQEYIAKLKDKRGAGMYPESYRSEWERVDLLVPAGGTIAGSFYFRAIGSSHIELRTDGINMNFGNNLASGGALKVLPAHLRPEKDTVIISYASLQGASDGMGNTNKNGGSMISVSIGSSGAIMWSLLPIGIGVILNAKDIRIRPMNTIYSVKRGQATMAMNAES